MSRRTDLRPLTDAEERTLIALADHRDRCDRYPALAGDGYMRPVECRNSTTLYNLAARDLLETRERPMTTVAKITDVGYQLVRGMGD